MREYRGVTREHIDEMGFSGGAERRGLSQREITCWPQFGETICIYIQK